MPSHLLKNAPVDPTPPVPVSPDEVEINIDGLLASINVYDKLPVLDSENCPEESNDSLQKQKLIEKQQGISSKSGKRLGKLHKKGKDASAKSDLGILLPFPKKKQEEGSGNSVKIKLQEAKFRIIEDYKQDDAEPRPNNAYIRYIEKTPEELYETVEYDIDELDLAWLELINELRGKDGPIKEDLFEFIIDRLEKESYFQMQSFGADIGPTIDDDAVCCICMDGECQNANAILFCDMCNLPVHQECYGVPYIPEGTWLCRRCYLSPSVAVSCLLCPNKGGAFKQTACDRWAHVSCAIWIPEVCFANTVFLEPIDNINTIAAGRWKLTCFICKQKNVGACIQCFKTNCYTAFHVTCAQLAGLYMNMDPVKTPTGFVIRKTAYCTAHTPAGFESDKDSPTQRKNLKKTRKMLAERRCAAPVVSVPTIPAEKLAKITDEVNVAKKKELMRQINAFWQLKRHFRSGVPLLRRLQITSNSSMRSSRRCDNSQSTANSEWFAETTRIRQQLEKGRLLCELTRKREKIKREEIYIKVQEWDMRIQPLNHFMANIIDEMIDKDTHSIFKQPVDPEEVPDYITVVKNPMDLSTMRKKIYEFAYNNIEDLEKDFKLMIDNCLLYNSSDTMFYRAGVKMNELGGIILREAKRQYDKVGYLPGGIMSEVPPSGYKPGPPVIDEASLAADIENVLEDTERHTLPYQQHLERLQEMLDKSLDLTHPHSRKKKFKKIRTEIGRLKRKQRLEESGGATTGGEMSSVDEEDSVALSPYPQQLLVESSDAGDDDGESGASTKYSSIRSRLRSTDAETVHQQRQIQQTERLSRRQSRSFEEVALPLKTTIPSPDVIHRVYNTIPSTTTDNYGVSCNAPPISLQQRPRRGRPPKVYFARGRGIARPRLTTNRSIMIIKQRGLPNVRRGSFRGRGSRGRRSARPLRRSDRVVKQQMLAQMNSSSPVSSRQEKQAKPISRQGSPTSRHASPRLMNSRLSPGSRQASPTVPIISAKAQRQQSPILGSPLKPHQLHMLKNPHTISIEQYSPNSGVKRTVNLGDVFSPKSMEAAAKSIVCSEKYHYNKKGQVIKNQKPKQLIFPDSPIQTKTSGSPGKKNQVGANNRVVRKRNTAGRDSSKTVSQRILPQRKVRGPAAAVGKRNKTVNANDSKNALLMYSTGIAAISEKQQMQQYEQHKKNSRSLIPITNGLPSLPPFILGKQPSRILKTSRRPARSATQTATAHQQSASATTASGNYTNSVASSMYHHPLTGNHLKRSDSFSVYRSGGGDHNIDSYSEAESCNDDDDEIDENEDITGDEDDEKEEPEERDEDDDDEDEDDDDDENQESRGDGDESSDSDNSSDSDSDSSTSSSSSLSSSTTAASSSKASSSSTITNPKHFRPCPSKNKKRWMSGNSGGVIHQMVGKSGTLSSSSSTSSENPIRQTVGSPMTTVSSNNNNNILYSNKEKEKELFSSTTMHQGSAGLGRPSSNDISSSTAAPL